MKTLTQALLVIITTVAAGTMANDARASDNLVFQIRNQIQTANVLRADMDPALTTDSVQGGTVVLDLAKNTLTVSLGSSLVIELPIVQTSHDDCGTTIYTARQDLRTTDGALQQIVLHDNTENTCNTSEAQTQLIYTTSSRTINTRSEIDADALMPRL